MTKDEIKNLISLEIAGQGNQVDAGGALSEILIAITEAAFAGANVQSDWTQDESSAPDFIKNKPSIPEPSVVKISALPTPGMTRAELDDIGLSSDVLDQIAQNKGRAVIAYGVLDGSDFIYQVFSVTEAFEGVLDGNMWVKFGRLTYTPTSGKLNFTQYRVVNSPNHYVYPPTVDVETIEIPLANG